MISEEFKLDWRKHYLSLESILIIFDSKVSHQKENNCSNISKDKKNVHYRSESGLFSSLVIIVVGVFEE